MKKWLALAVSVTIVGALLYGGYEWQQHHLSDGFRQIMLALFDPSSTDADMRGYLHDARLAAKTPEDHRLLTQMETLISLRVRAAAKRQEAEQNLLIIPPELLQSEEDRRIGAAAEKSSAKVYDLYMKQSKTYADQANVLEKSIRSELKLPSEKSSSPR